MKKSKTIVLIHGNFVNKHVWEAWKKHYEQKGYTVHTPANPGHDGTPAELRKNVHPDLANTEIKEVVKNIAQLIEPLPEKPFVIGHSMAGVVVMKLIEMGKCCRLHPGLVRKPLSKFLIGFISSSTLKSG